MLIDPKTMRFASALSSAVILKGFLLYGGFRLGSWLDGRWGTYPFLMVLLLAAGGAVGIWWIVFVADRYKL